MKKGITSEVPTDLCIKQEKAQDHLRLKSGINEKLICAKGKSDTCGGKI